MDGFQVRKNGIPDNHMDMAKFEDPDSAGYQRTVGYLQEWICDIEAGGDNSK